MSTLIGNLLEKIGLDTSSRMGGSVQFFIYVIVGLVTYFYPEVTVEKMSTYRKKQ